MIQSFLRRASRPAADSPPPQGYGSLPTTEDYDDDDDDASTASSLLPLPVTAAASPATGDRPHPTMESSWLDLPETPSPYAAAGYQRLDIAVSPIAASAVDDSYLEEQDYDIHTSRSPYDTTSMSYQQQQPPHESTPLASSFPSSSASPPHCHILEGDDEDYESTLLLQTSYNTDHDDATTTPFHGKASIASEIATMTKAIVGCGVLSLPGGIALYSNTPTAVFSAIFWILLMAAIFAYACFLLGKICHYTHASTFAACAHATLGRRAALVVSLANATKAGLADLAYSTILSQTMASLCHTFLGWKASRLTSLWLVTLVAILPLCMLQNIHGLAPFSVLGTLGILLTAAAMVVRLVDGSYRPGGQYYNDIPTSLQPDFSSDDDDDDQQWTSYSSHVIHMLPFVCMLFESFVMHYNSPRFYAELERTSLPRFAVVVLGAFGLSTLIFAVIACAGFLTFGGHADGYILNNYSHRDPLATMSRVAIALAILLTYPLAFIGMRDGVLHSLHVSVNGHVLTLVLLGGITLTASVVTDLGMINAVGGGTLAMAIVFVFPTIMYRAAIQQKGAMATIGQRREVVLALVLMVFGVAIGLIGTWLALMNAR